MSERFSSLKIGLLLSLPLVLVGCGEGTSDAPGEAAMPPRARPNLIVLLVDTLRADALGFAGYGEPISPRLDRWAARGAIFEQATTPAGWTKPAVVSLFTGLYPATHSVQDKDHVAPDELLMLAEVLGSQGYDTAAFVTNYAVSADFGCDQGFRHFRFFDKDVDAPPDAPRQLNYVQAEHVMPEVRAYLEREHERPFFLYVHLTDPHYPYIPPMEHLLFGTTPRGRYDGEVHYVDEQLGSLMDFIEARGLLSESIVLLTADHGEEFREHGGTGHGITVFEECIRVPLVFWGAGVTPGRLTSQVSLSDVPATLLEGGSLPTPPGFAGQARSFWPMLRSGEAGGWSWSYAELVYPTKGITFSYREGDEKVLYIERDKLGREDEHYLFDLASDPTEQQDLEKERPERFAELQGRMRSVRQEHLDRAVAPLQEELSEDAIRRLRALGYID